MRDNRIVGLSESGDMEIDDARIGYLARSVPGDISIYEVTDGQLKVLYFSEGVPGLSGMTTEEYQTTIAGDASSIVIGTDRKIVADELAVALASNRDADLTYRIAHRELGSVWVHAKSRMVGKINGNPVVLAVFMDTTLETELHESLLDQVTEAVHVCDAETRELLYVNKMARQTWGVDGEFQGVTCYELLHGRGKVCPWCGAADCGGEDVHLDEMYDADIDRYFRYDRRLVSWHGRRALAVFTTDITESRKARESLAVRKDLLEDIIEHIPAGVCVFRIVDGKAGLVAANEYLREVLQTTMEDLADFEDDPILARVHPDDRDEAFRVTRELMSGEDFSTCEFRLADDVAKMYHWLHLDARAMEQDDGTSLIFATVIDISSRKAAEEHYRESMGDLLAANPHALCAFELNLTRNTCDEGRGTSEYVQKALVSDTADGVFKNLAGLIVDEEGLEACRRVFDLGYLISSFENGKDHLSLEYRRMSEYGGTIWARTFITMVRNPTTGDVEAVVYSEDINTRKRKEIANRIVVENGYDYIGLIEKSTNSFMFNDMGAQIPERYLEDFHADSIPRDYDAVRNLTASSWVHPEDREFFLESSSLDSIASALDSRGHYEYALRALRDNSSVRRKRLQYAYLDDTHDSIVVWQTDVTEALQKEHDDAERLEIALSAAQQASNAKSVFLSRMSHEIRTPMNAIIGMDTLAVQAIGDDERVADCLSKIGISSRYLLSLINDILDMSRIESGKMMLKDESFLIRDLISSVDDLIFGQADVKGLDYECVVSGEVMEGYLGDVMKLQQVLVNLLGNAVKFTEHGKISLSVQQISLKGTQARLRFTVSDTGCGISDEDLQRVFDPFEQGDTSSTTVFGGTGLGLAITRSLLELMGGTIRARSIEGVGSEFIAEVPLTVDESVVGVTRQTYHFDEMKTLVVDDDLVVCEQAEEILKDIGMVAEWVTSGTEAVAKVKGITAEGGRYDFVLIDWKMPEMDGVETTRRIRRIVGPDVTIIIISAYDWQSIEFEAKDAGANMLISKPLFRSTLISAFQKAANQTVERSVEVREYDFSGRHVLVAEDNMMNSEIAQNLLESKGFEVELAKDGLETMEKFTQNPAGYYDAILMDIRMPQMDGLQATSNIRHWNRPDAKTIPIIAMTANAFDEDVEKSHAVGMDAHLAKPIEPEIMFRTLQRIIPMNANKQV